MIRNIVICADDYAISESVSKAICNLIEKNKISAASCMTTLSRWKQDALHLHPYKNKVDIGLHFTLTEGLALKVNPVNKKSLNFSSLTLLLAKSHLGFINYQSVKCEFKAQLEKFIEHFGQFPDFIDGHQHIHHFPVIRKAMLDTLKEVMPDKAYYIRVVDPCISLPQSILSKAQLKKLIILKTGANKLKALLKKSHIAFNNHFAGIYDFNNPEQFPLKHKTLIQSLPNNTLIMCHPAQYYDNLDPLTKIRCNEYQWLMSSEFANLCSDVHIKIVRYLDRNHTNSQ